MTPREHVLGAEHVHHAWDNGLEPVLVVRSGDIVHFDLLMSGAGQVHEGARADDVVFDFDTTYNLAGPIFIEDAPRGDTLEIEVLALDPGEWGWTAILPDLGLLPELFPKPFFKTWDLRGEQAALLTPNVRVPLSPFLGTMGNAVDEPGVHSPFPPHKGGGNLDNRHLVVGSSLFLPVWCEGALFSCGDPHAAQGDGEVCVSAIECGMKATLRFHVRDRVTATPAFRAPPVSAHGPTYGTMGIGPDLMECARTAVAAMIEWLGAAHNLMPEDAYVLCSVAGDLKIHEIVDAGVWNVGMTLPLELFEQV